MAFSLTIGQNTGDSYAGVKLIGIESADPDGNDPNPFARMNGNSRRAVCEIDFAAARAGVDADASDLTVASLHWDKNNTTGEVEHTVYELLRTVVMNQVTWNSFSAGNAWATPGAQGSGDYDPTPLAAVTISAAPGYQVFESVDLSAAMLAAFNAGAKLWILGDANPADFTNTEYHKDTETSDGQLPFVTLAGETGGSVPIAALARNANQVQ